MFKTTEALAASGSKLFAPNATYPKAPEPHEFDDLEIVRAWRYALTTGQRLLVIAGQGMGKTQFFLDMGRAEDIDVVYINCPMTSVENLVLRMPHDDPETGTKVLDAIPYERLMSDKPKVILLDEAFLMAADAKHTLLEIAQQGSIDDIKIPGLLSVIALSNPPGGMYGRNTGFNFAGADRFMTLVEPKTPWRRGLAATFPDMDLNPLFKVYDRTSKATREIISPRKLEHIIWAAGNGFPLEGVLPKWNGNRMRLSDDNGNDVTDKVLADMAAALGTTNRDRVPGLMDKLIAAAMRDGQNILLEGPPGIAKTAKVNQIVAAAGKELVYLSSPVTSPEDNCLPFPNGEKLDMMIARKWITPNEKVLFIDDYTLGSWPTLCQLMEPMQQRTLGGKPIPGLLCTIAASNPKEFAGMKMDVGRPNLAQVTRFAYTLEVGLTDSGWPEYLLGENAEDETHRAIAEQVIEWWKEDLNDEERVRITARTCKRLIDQAKFDLPLEWAKAFVDGEYVPVPLNDLQTRLANQPLARLRAVAQKVEYYEAKLAEGENHNLEEHLAVYVAFLKAEPSQLEANQAVCVRLMRVLAQRHVIDLIKAGGTRQQFWYKVLKEAKSGPAAS